MGIALGVVSASGAWALDAAIEKSQPALLKTEVARVAPQRKGITDIFTLGVAGWSDQDVFLKELDGALGSVAQALPVKGRVARLVNNPKTTRRVPLATPRNIGAAIDAVASRMDKEDDVLILFMTSHGLMSGLALKLPGGDNALIAPQDVATALDRAGVKHRVVIVSACYSGVFVRSLANDNTIVVTAADSWNSSFGCAAGRDWTYFGDAFFKQSLQPGTDFKRAFDRARILIEGWEKLDRLTPSNPQGHFGPALTAKLAPIFAAMPRPEQ